MAVLLMVSLLIPPVMTTGTQTLDGARDSENRKRALGAAEAGLAVARSRLAGVALGPADCLTHVPVAPVNGECPGHTESLGNGASYTYHVSPELGAGGQCAPTNPGRPTAGVQRCITATGEVNGVTRRVQLRAGVGQELQAFGEAGIIGLESVSLVNSVTSQGSVGSNGPIHLHNSITVTGSLLPSPTASIQIGDSVVVTGGTQTRSTPWDLPDVDFSASQTANDNSALPISYYSDSTRTFAIPSGNYTMPGGTYNLCNLSLGNSVRLQIPSDQVVRIYIDSPTRAGSGCAGGGQFRADNSVEVNRDANVAGNLEIYVYGTGTETASNPDIRLGNSVWLTGSVYAPRSTFDAVNSAVISGGIAARVVRLGNSVEFVLPLDVQSKAFAAGGAGTTQRAWTECSATPPVPSDPESGC